MNEQSVSAMDKLRSRFQGLRERARKTLPFASGVAAALVALLAYDLLFPGPQQLTPKQVNDAVISAMASATPRPAYSAAVYQVIQPSLVLIQTQGTDRSGHAENGLGSGVIIDQNADIFTSLHVVADAKKIKLTFADGTYSSSGLFPQPEKDIAVLQPLKLPQHFLPATIGNPGALQEGDEAYVVGNPFGLYSSMSAGVISGFDRTFQPGQWDATLKD